MTAPTAPAPAAAVDPVTRHGDGRRLRQRVRRRDLAALDLPADRDALAVLEAQEARRVPELVGLRHERMLASPFAFFRGAAAVFATDLAPSPRSDLRVQLCGDAHLANFGGFASPDRCLVFDLNDFDETLPGPFEWDLKRLAASFEVAGRANGLEATEREAVVRATTRAYARALARYAAMDHLDLWYLRLDADQVLAEHAAELTPEAAERLRRNLSKAKTKDRMKALRRLTVADGDGLRFASDPPVLQPVSELMAAHERDALVATVTEALRAYRHSLQPDRRLLLERYRFVDLARKVVGVGSVGTRCWVALLLGREGADPLFLQVKEAERSVLEPHLDRSAYDHQGRRVVEGQRIVQSASDIFLGWERVRAPDGVVRDSYVRQLWDWKISADVDAMDTSMLTAYARMCGLTLARAHARSGDPVALTGYVGGGGALGEAMAGFAAAYADVNEADHAAAVARWSAPAEADADAEVS